LEIEASCWSLKTEKGVVVEDLTAGGRGERKEEIGEGKEGKGKIGSRYYEGTWSDDQRGGSF
jgi:hypothetical protein